MIEADIRGKFGSEDIFTSCCIGLLNLLPDFYLLSFLQKAVNLCGCSLSLDKSLSIKTLDFWPSFSSGYPDVVLVLEDDTILIIEVKHGARKHGSDFSTQNSINYIEKNASSSSENENNSEQIDEEDKKTRDQLAKYWCDARKKYPSSRVSLIYLTHHRSIPKDDLMESEKSAKLQCGESDLYWLNWFTLYSCIVNDWILDSASSHSEKKIFELLYQYLTNKKYVCFLGWDLLPKAVPFLQSYKKCYDWTATNIATFFKYHHNCAVAINKLPGVYIHYYRFDLSPMNQRSLCFYLP